MTFTEVELRIRLMAHAAKHPCIGTRRHDLYEPTDEYQTWRCFKCRHCGENIHIHVDKRSLEIE